MALPNGVSTCTLSVGKAISFLGTEASISVAVRGSMAIVHSASGWALYPATDLAATNIGGDPTVTVPHVNQAGFVNTLGAPVTNWYYTVTIKVTFPSGESQSFDTTVQPVVGQATIDLDLVPRTSPSGVVTGTVPAVTSVAGETGTVTLAELEAAGVATGGIHYFADYDSLHFVDSNGRVYLAVGGAVDVDSAPYAQLMVTLGDEDGGNALMYATIDAGNRLKVWGELIAHSNNSVTPHFLNLDGEGSPVGRTLQDGTLMKETPRGTLYRNTNGATNWTGDSLWRKVGQPGTDTWQVIDGDTGWRDISVAMGAGGTADRRVTARRINDRVVVCFDPGFIHSHSWSDYSGNELPSGFGATATSVNNPRGAITATAVADDHTPYGFVTMYPEGTLGGGYTIASGETMPSGTWGCTFDFQTTQPWPTALPGAKITDPFL